MRGNLNQPAMIQLADLPHVIPVCFDYILVHDPFGMQCIKHAVRVQVQNLVVPHSFVTAVRLPLSHVHK